MSIVSLDYNQRRYACAERIGIISAEACLSTHPERLIPSLPDPENPACPCDALALVKWMREKRWACDIGNGLDSTWECTFYIPQGDKSYYAPAPTFTAAIVLAFLAATAGEERES